jgi:hypothetical protein
MPTLRRRLTSIAATLTLATVVPTSGVQSQRAPLVGSVSPSAIGPAAPQPAPIGGLRTVPLSSGAIPSGASPSGGLRGGSRRGAASTLGYDRGLRVIDAPLPRGLGSASSTNGEPSIAAPRWLPTYDKPRWVADTTAVASPLWRSLIVTDVVCTPAARCQERTQRVRATWMARCDCYAFADGWSRVWRVGTRTRSPVQTRTPSAIRMVRTDSTE